MGQLRAFADGEEFLGQLPLYLGPLFFEDLRISRSTLFVGLSQHCDILSGALLSKLEDKCMEYLALCNSFPQARVNVGT